MDRKLTRRAVIGSIVGGAVAAPFIIQHLRPKSDETPSAPPGQTKGNYDYAAEWTRRLATTNTPIKQITLQRATVGSDPGIGQEYLVRSVYASYDEGSNPRSFPEAPRYYTAAEGRVSSVSPIVNNHATLLIAADRQVVVTQHSFDQRAGDKCYLVLGSAEADYYHMGPSAPQKLPAPKVNPVCDVLGRNIWFEAPPESLERGTTWTLPETSRYSLELTCSVAGFVRVAGRDTARIEVERKLTNQEFLRYIECQMAREKKEMEGISDVDFDAEAEKRLAQARGQGTTLDFQLACCVDLRTGLALRTEITMQKQSANSPDMGHTGVFVTQAFPS